MIRKPGKYLALACLLALSCGRSFAADRLPLAVYRLPRTNCRLPLAVGRWRRTAVFLPLTIYHQPFTPPATDTLPRYAVGDIFIAGNRVTRTYIIERELPFRTGDSLNMAQIVRGFTESRQHLINTRLFNEVKVYLKEFRGRVVDVGIDVKERWYIFPLPYIRPIDRNLTAWADQHYSLKRFDYGIKYSQYNLTGRNDYLRIWLLTGYTRQAEIAYDRPNIGPDPKHGFGGGFLYGGQRELNVATIRNRQTFVNRDSLMNAGKYMREQWNFSLRYYYRPALRTNHYFRFSFNHVQIDSSVLFFNPDYLAGHRVSVDYPEFSYAVRYNVIDYVPYPTKGFFLEGGLLKRGISSEMNLWQTNARVITAVPLAPKWTFVADELGLLRLPFRQPFFNKQLLGYNDYYMRGLERYVVDGVGGLVARNSLLRELTRFSIPFLRGTSHDLIPFRIYAKAYLDLGYVYDKYDNGNSLVNRGLYSGGVGFDVVTFYDFVFRAEFSLNQLGEKGVFFHIRNDF